MAGSISISGAITAIPPGVYKPGPFSIPGNSSSDFENISQSLVMGDNTITIPTWAAGVLIIPPTANTSALILKGDPGDVGILISKNRPSLIPFPTSPSSVLIINSAAAVSALTSFVFF